MVTFSLPSPLSLLKFPTVNQNVAVRNMQNAIDAINKWTVADKLKLNDAKSEFIIIGTRQQLVKINVDNLRVGDALLKPLNKVRNLGCWLDPHLGMVTHINKVCQTAFYYLHNMRKITDVSWMK